ncbi:MAG: serine/threonine protein kinase [Bdellovibrionales bacterium]
MARDFYDLQPETVMDVTEEVGFQPTGEFLQLNSYENRVFKIKLEDKSQIVAKFYRPGRWSREQILEEHEFLQELGAEGLDVNQPVVLKNKSTLYDWQGIGVAFFPLFQGRSVSELLEGDWPRIGRLIARVHNVGELKQPQHRLWMTPSDHPNGWDALETLQEWLDPSLRTRYSKAASEILELYEDTVDPDSFLRVHGDVHRGNLLQRDQTFFLVDFDDHVMGPAIQDLWMLFTEESEFDFEREQFLEGYEELRHFPRDQFAWIPLLRGFRILGYAAWIARRWTDPSFPRLFPDFNTYNYWAEETEALEKCLASFSRS